MAPEAFTGKGYGTVVPWLFSPVEVPQILFIDSVEDIPVWQQRQVPWRFLASGGASDSVFDSGIDIPV